LILVALLAVGSALWALGANGSYYANVGVLTLLSLTLAVSVRPLLVGCEASFCHGAFYAVGAYAVAILTTRTDCSIWLALPAGGVVAALAAFVIGVVSLRSTGATFFVMTFSFLVLTTALFQYATGLTGGFNGISGVPSLVSFADVASFYWVTVGFAGASVLVFAIVDRSRWGLELRALGESYALAASAGIGRLGNLLGAFALGAFFAGVAGGFYASFISFISPTSFSFWLSIYVLTYVMVGGARSIAGPVVGTAIVGVLPLLSGWSDASSGVFVSGATLVILLLLPRGVVVSGLEALRRRAPQRRSTRAAEGTLASAAQASSGSVVRARAPRRIDRAEQPLMRVEQLSKHFGGVAALSEVTFEVHAGEVLGIIGPNGAGKTTLFNAISGFSRPSRGRVWFEGEEITGVPGHRLVHRGITRTFQASTVFEGLSVRDNVLVAGAVGERPGVLRRLVLPLHRDPGATAAADRVLERFELQGWADAPAADLPYGLRKMLGVAIAMATGPRLLCLDEPLAGLSEAEADRMMDAVASLSDQHGVTIVVIEHRIRSLVRVCERMLALDAGCLVAEGEPAAVLANPEIVSAYLGTPFTEVAHA